MSAVSEAENPRTSREDERGTLLCRQPLKAGNERECDRLAGFVPGLGAGSASSNKASGKGSSHQGSSDLVGCVRRPLTLVGRRASSRK